MKAWTTAGLIALMAALTAFTANIAGQETADPEATVVKVNETVITEKEVAAQTEKQIAAQAQRMPPEMEINEWMRNQIRTGVVDMMVQQALIEEKLTEKEITITDERVRAEITQIAQAQNLNLEELQAEVARYGMTVEDLHDQIRLRLQIESLIDAEMADKEVSDEAVRAFYDENPQYFEQPEQVRAAHVLVLTQDKTEEEKIAARQRIEKVLQKAKAGEDFADLAREYSEDPGSREQGGEYTFPRGQMVPEFEQAAFSMEPGQVSDIIETMYGYHVIKKYEHIEPVKQSFEDARGIIKEHLARQQRGQFWEEYVEKMKQDADIAYSESEQQRRDQSAPPQGMPQMAP